MSQFVFSPALGWPAAIALVALLCVMAVAQVTLHVRRKDSDETLFACVRRVLICLTLAVMVLTPSVISSTTSRAVNATDVVVAVDVTGSMAVSDAHYGSDETVSRLDAAKQAVHDLTEQYADASFAALRFGASATLDVPLTPDSLAIDNWADTLSVESTSVSAGSSLDAPIDQLLLTLKSIRDQHPDDAVILYLITDGEQTSTTTRRTFSSLRQYLDDAFAVGVGSTEGGRIPLVSDGVGEIDPDTENWVTDPDTGEPGISAMDEAILSELADEMSGSVVILSAEQTLANGVSAEASDQWRVTSTTKERQRTTPVVWPEAIVLLALLAMEAGAWIATSRRLI
ncbi:von Willebrand factor type A domain [Bifidobacterium lemurum]|uniref:von Willebrand factor type A domain n=1 Tax=Bifidobacterium lemurum TaxID=1603886 RepID=A0A261FTK4_9BIFI|nr:VWA domain-containing protein [Bifidobacterium lemurum]OZG62295.1 von Willebrand factor type A domain [Bifidobacterium lemurum]QOL33661.1 VWA domain-containing protein [Bifidobacterium lemurum]